MVNYCVTSLIAAAEDGNHLCSLFVDQLMDKLRSISNSETLSDNPQCLVGLLFNRGPELGTTLLWLSEARQVDF